ncbi:MAG: hypothetical protein H6922_02645 [Pseudomonadaceae bacterium]|nr:hypothetical protein [Pseudomonadaceae bacterium]
MKSTLTVLAVVLSIASFAGMLRLKTDVESLAGKRARLVAEHSRLREEKQVLEAELAHLAQPATLHRFAAKRGYVPLATTMLVPMNPEAGGGDGMVE